MEKSTKLTFRISPEQLKTLKMLADGEGRSMASMLRRLVDKEKEQKICTDTSKNGEVSSVVVAK